MSHSTTLSQAETTTRKQTRCCRSWGSCKRRRAAFSLLELLAVVTILGLLAAMILVNVTGASDKAKRKLNAHHKAALNATVERYFLEKGTWPSVNMNELAPLYFPDGLPVSPFDGVTAYTLDATSHRVNNVPNP